MDGGQDSRSGTDELLAFVWDRTAQTHHEAVARGDDLRARFAQRSMTILVDIRATLDDGASIGELMAHRYLRRMAHDYRDHPDYRQEWLLYP